VGAEEGCSFEPAFCPQSAVAAEYIVWP